MIWPIPYSIRRIVYLEEYFISVETGREKTRYVFLPDGTIEKRQFRGSSRKCIKKETYHVSVERMRNFYEAIHDCIRNANGYDAICDDCSGTLTIDYDYMHSETVDRGTASDDTYISDLVVEMIQITEPDKD